MPNHDGVYETKHTALAAYLYMQGFELVDVKCDGFPSIFIFEKSQALLDEAHKWQVADAPGNCFFFFEAYRQCLKMTKIGKL